eukprot:Blabericola_migrator_1__9098@NODE_4857_length_954_cov_81_944758_g3035_i0_p1_GENE_NODE_4857_length_954_cov_81_944758_g3035_i0NODE_4857_length_954_cov_81_944758_g3035_i0_p1_ORF_typecomplete_len212_score23_87_NODE_4857_length_954_cov_81_944758_g3035_i0168803
MVRSVISTNQEAGLSGGDDTLMDTPLSMHTNTSQSCLSKLHDTIANSDDVVLNSSIFVVKCTVAYVGLQTLFFAAGSLLRCIERLRIKDIDRTKKAGVQEYTHNPIRLIVKALGKRGLEASNSDSTALRPQGSEEYNTMRGSHDHADAEVKVADEAVLTDPTAIVGDPMDQEGPDESKETKSRESAIHPESEHTETAKEEHLVQHAGPHGE